MVPADVELEVCPQELRVTTELQKDFVFDSSARDQSPMDATEDPGPQGHDVGRPRIAAAEPAGPTPRAPDGRKGLASPVPIRMGQERPRPLEVVQVVSPELRCPRLGPV